MFCCLKYCSNRDIGATAPFHKIHDPEIQLDTTHMGHQIVIIKSGKRLCGSGGALATAPLVQSKSYFEVKIQQNGQWSVGLATRDADLNKTKGGMDKESWCLCSDNKIRHNGEELCSIANSFLSITGDSGCNGGGFESCSDQQSLVKVDDDDNDSINIQKEINQNIPKKLMIEEGDTIGVAYDHVELNFYLNGKNLEVPILNVKGTVYPALYVDDGAILDLILDNFNYTPPQGFEEIMVEQSLL